MLDKLKKITYERLIKPLYFSNYPISQLALGSGVGMFWAMNPLVGIQTYIVFMNWWLFKKIGIHFHVPVALAFIWISNPITIGPFYFSFYYTGVFLLKSFDMKGEIISYQHFIEKLKIATDMKLWDGTLYWLDQLYNYFFWPMLVGSLLYAIPLAIASYYGTIYFMRKKRKNSKL